jgi:hypothetical protein
MKLEMNKDRYQKQILWEKWVRTPIFADSGVYTIDSRYSVIKDFVEKGLIPFTKKKGYIFFDRPESVTLSLLRYLFALHIGQKVVFNEPHKNIPKDHRFEFEHRFDSMELEEFWEQWKEIEDFQEGRSGHVLLHTLPQFLWASLNIEDSPITIEIEKILDEVAEMEEIEWRKESKGKDDPYLHDTSKVNYEDRHWH